MRRWFYIGVIIALAALVYFSSQKEDEVERASGKFDQAVYVWQRAWSPEVKSAIAQRESAFKHVTVLAAEIDWRESQGWSITGVREAISYAKQNPERSAGVTSAGVAIRISARVAKLKWDKTSISYALEMIDPVVKGIKRVQIDYDCPTSKLADYARFLKALRVRYPEKVLEFTALPDWLHSDEFSNLLEHVDSYVMQVHGVSGHGAGWVLCDAQQARRIAEKCATFAKPYLIALPTYRHVLHLNKKGEIADVSSEGGQLTSGMSHEVVSAKPAELANLIRAWESDRPALMQGVVWFRLPVPADKMNWTWETLQNVMRGEAPIGELKLSLEQSPEGLVELFIHNNTQMRLDWPKEVKFEWERAFCIAHGVGEAYTQQQFDRKNSITMRWRFHQKEAIHPEQKVRVAWFRFDRAEQVLSSAILSQRNILLDEKGSAKSE